MLEFDASIFCGELPVGLVSLALRSCSQAAISSMRVALSGMRHQALGR